MKRHKWKKNQIIDDTYPFNIVQCINCNIYRIIYKTKNNYCTLYVYDLPILEIKDNNIHYVIDDNADKVAPNCITKEIIDEFINEKNER